MSKGNAGAPGRRRIAFFDYADVFEDFYPHYGIDQVAFATRWAATGNHAFVTVLQREVADVVWYETSLEPHVASRRHETTGCQVTFLSSSWLHRFLWKLFYLPRNAWRWRGAYRAFATVASYLAPLSAQVWTTLRRDKPECFFVQSYSSGRFDVLLLFARLLKARFVAYHAGGEANRYLGATIRRWTLRLADRIIVSSRTEAEMLVSQYRVPREKLRLILTPIDTRTFQPMHREAACQASSLIPQRRYLLFVGRFDDGTKRVSAIIRSFASVAANYPDADLLLVGNGRDDARLREVAAETAPGRIRFVGWVGEEDRKAQLYNCAECLILASWREGFPTVVGEAMSCGTPVLSSNVGG